MKPKHRIDSNSAHARWLVIALGVFIVLAASAHGQTPVFIPNFAFDVEKGQSGIKSVARLKEGTHARETPCVAKIDDIVSLEIGNLEGWLEKLKKDKVIDSEEAETGGPLVLEQLSKLNLFIDEHLMRTLKPTEYLKDDPSWYSDPEQKKTAVGRSWLEFTLKRDAVNKESRADWDPVLRTRGLSRQMFSPQMQLAVGIFNAKGNAAYVMALPPVGGDTPNSQLEFHLQLISWDGWTIF